MEIISCIVVDDEPIARNIIEKYCSHFPYIKVVGSCSNAIEAKLFLQQQPVQLVFLDINMPVMDGISFLKTLKPAPQVIFTTAYKEFAIDAFDLAACDYLLKPFSFERFCMAIDRVLEKLRTLAASNKPETSTQEDSIFIKADGKMFKIAFDDLLYAEASGNYIRIVTSQNIYLPALTFTTLEESLPQSQFVRTHRSFIINKTKISYIEGNRVCIGKTFIPIGNNYKEHFFRQIGAGDR